MIDKAALRALLVEAAAEGARIALAEHAAAHRPRSGLEPMLDIVQAGAVLHVTPRTVRAWCSSGRLKSRLVGHRRLIAESDVRALLERAGDEDAAIAREARRMIEAERRAAARPLRPRPPRG